MKHDKQKDGKWKRDGDDLIQGVLGTQEGEREWEGNSIWGNSYAASIHTFKASNITIMLVA